MNIEDLDITIIKLYINMCKEFDKSFIKERFNLAVAQINTGRFDKSEEIKRVEQMR